MQVCPRHEVESYWIRYTLSLADWSDSENVVLILTII